MNFKPPVGTKPNLSDPQMKDLIGWWLLNEGAGVKAFDSAGKGNAGTMTNFANPSTATSGWSAGKFGPGLQFDGIDDYVNVGTNIRPVRNMSVSAWIKVKNFPPAGTNLDGIAGDNLDASFVVGWWLGLYGTNVLRFKINEWNINFADFTGFTDTTRWHHVMGTYDGATIKVYLDGVVGGTVGTLASDISYTSTDGLKFGQGFSGGADGGKFDGSIDDVRIYNRAPSTQEAWQPYTNPFSMFDYHAKRRAWANAVEENRPPHARQVVMRHRQRPRAVYPT